MTKTMTKTLLASISVVAFANSTNAVLVQWTAEVGGNGHFYDITPSRMNWDGAESYAVSLGGHLASITSAAEQSFINSTFLSGANDRLPLWIGLTDTAVEGTFVWTTGEPLTFTNWDAVGEPNNFGNEDYVAINWYRGADAGGTKGSWNDVHINGTTSPSDPITMPYFGVVEVVPEPGTAVSMIASVAVFGILRRRRR